MNGKTYSLNNVSGNIIQPNYVKNIPNLGMIRKNTAGKLSIKFIVKFPESLSEKQINKLKDIL